MRMNFALEINQKQKLILTNRIQQSINILQMSAYELREYINSEFEQNPLLESDFNDNVEMINIEHKAIMEDRYVEPYSYNSVADNSDSPLNYISESISLKDTLLEQLRWIKESSDIKKIVLYMIEGLDSRGYLGASIEEVSTELLISIDKVNKSLHILQAMEPCGVGSRNLSECLLLQVKKKDIYDKNIEKIILKYLDLVGENKYVQISSKLQISAKRAQEYVDIIRSLEPKPSRGYYSGEETKYIVPDAEVRFHNGEKIIIMNNSIIPTIKINSDYYKLSKVNADKDINKYFNDKIENGNFLIKSIENRKITLRNILQILVQRQSDYFTKGKNYLKPLTLKDVALELGIHESTVSRAIKEKYILTSYGTIRIKDLFCGKLTEGSIKSMISDLIESENKKSPLSDQSIATKLKDLSVIISRRTVAKYREELGIKNSSARKRL